MDTDYIKIIGGHGQRQKWDYYPTPPECTIALINFTKLPPDLVIWEPAAGEGHMADVIRRNGNKVIETDIQTGHDFLTTPCPEGVNVIITNPPFSKSVEFIRRCDELHKPFALLLKSQYWHSAKRKPLFDEIRPTYVLPLTWRPDFLGKGASMMDMIWCVWSLDARLNRVTYYQPLNKPAKEE